MAFHLHRRSNEIVLGNHVGTRRPFAVPFERLRETSTLVVGSSGSGKSRWQSDVFDQIIEHGYGATTIDLHGTQISYAAWRLRRRGVPASKVIVVEPTDGQHSLGFNPLSCGTEGDPGESASMVLDAIMKAWGVRSFDATPRLEGILRGTLHLLAASGLSILEAPEVLSVENVALRRALLRNVHDEFVRNDWKQFEALAKSDKLAVVDSTRSRLRRLIHAPAMQRMFGQTKSTWNALAAMESGSYVLVNLHGLPPEVARLLGGLVFGALFRASKFRNPRTCRPHFLVADEAHAFLTEDAINIADQARKFGLHLILSIQRLGQLDREGPDMTNALLTNARVKVVFSVCRRDAEILAHEVNAGEVNGDRIKHTIEQTKFRPVDDVFEVESESESRSSGLSRSGGESWSESSSDSESQTDSHLEIPDDPFRRWEELPFNRAESRGRQAGRSRGESESSALSEVHSTSRSSSLVPYTRHEAFSEVSGIACHSVSDEWERRISALQCLPKREAIIRIFNEPSVHIRTRDVADEVVDDRATRYRKKVMETSPYVHSADVVQSQIEDRRERLAQMTADAEEEGRPFNVRSFRE